MAGLKMNPHTVSGAAGDKPNGFYCAARCENCTDIHFAVGAANVVRSENGNVLATIMMTASEARQLAAELLALAEVH